MLKRYKTSKQKKENDIMPTFTNKATLSYNGKSVDSNTVIGNFTETVSVTKTALVGEYGAGSTLTYVVSIVNSGATAANGLIIEDDLGGYDFGATTLYPLEYVDGSLAYFVNGVLQPTPTLVAGPPLVISGVNIPANSNAILVYEAAVTEYAPLGVDDSITNTVNVNCSIAEALSDSETVTTADEPLLTISKSLSPTEVVENGQLTYTFVIQNLGNTEAVATDNVVVTDIFDPTLTITSVELNGAPLALGTGYTYNEATGEFATTIGAITVPAATYTKEADGTYTTNPGSVILTVTGTI